jgi:rod shape determining protein RodA
MKNVLSHIDWWLLIPVLFLVIISLTILFSINPSYFRNQLFGLGISLFAFLLFSQISYRDFRQFSVPFYVTSIILLIIVLIIGIESRGAIRWFEVFGISLQASEIGKPLMSLALAGFLADNSNRRLSTYLLTLLYLAPAVFLIYLQPDLGNAILYMIVAILTLLIYGIPLIWFMVSIFPAFIFVPFLWNFMHDYQRQRILTFLNPMQDPRGSSYNLIQAIIAVGSGMLIGKGINEGTQSRLKFLPENHTDFIFASLAEKLGFLGSLIIIIFFIIFLYRIYIIINKSDDLFGKIFASSSFLFVLLQFFVNIGMNLGLVPVVGITLPFISYGGSSLLANFILLGILSSISTRNKKNEILEIR